MMWCPPTARFGAERQHVVEHLRQPDHHRGVPVQVVAEMLKAHHLSHLRQPRHQARVL